MTLRAPAPAARVQGDRAGAVRRRRHVEHGDSTQLPHACANRPREGSLRVDPELLAYLLRLAVVDDEVRMVSGALDRGHDLVCPLLLHPVVSQREAPGVEAQAAAVLTRKERAVPRQVSVDELSNIHVPPFAGLNLSEHALVYGEAE